MSTPQDPIVISDDEGDDVKPDAVGGEHMPAPSSSNGGGTGSRAGQDLVLIIYVHGFKGTDVTFEHFPERLQHLVQETVSLSPQSSGVRVESILFPVYETRGELGAAVERFVDWLAGLVVAREVDHGAGGGAGKAKVVLCGHSMGGLLIADGVLSLRANAAGGPDEPLWPRVVAVIAFDTPYLGLHPHVFKNGLSKYAGHVETARQVASNLGSFGAAASGIAGSAAAWFGGSGSSSKQNEKSTQQRSWRSTGLLAASAIGGLAAAAGAAAYVRRDDLAFGWTWVNDHAVWLKNLWDSEGLKRRIGGLQEVVEGGKHGIVFRNFYTQLAPDPPDHLLSRTFCVVPASQAPLGEYWQPVAITTTTSSSSASTPPASPSSGDASSSRRRKRPDDEIAAHLGMFDASTNESYYTMGLEVSKAVWEAVERTREGVQTN